jgi:toxin HigB-1
VVSDRGARLTDAEKPESADGLLESFPRHELALDDINAARYYHERMIESFACAETGKVFEGQMSRRLPTDIQRIGRRKLLQLHAATQLRDLAVPPGNRLEALKGGRTGQHSIRINDQWRVCFRWESGAHEVEIVDYH